MNDASKPSTLSARLPWIITAVAVVAAGYLFITRGQPAGGDASVAQLNERLAALEQSQGGSRASSARGGASQSAADREAAMSMRETQTPEQAKAAQEKQLRELEAQFSRDAADPATGPKTENILVQTVSGETMAGTGLKPNDVDIACKKNSCRIVGTFDRMGDAQDWGLFYITAAGGNVLSQTQMVYVPKPGGKTEVRIYSTRAKG